MKLAEVVKLLGQHGVNLTLTEKGTLKPTAGRPPPAEVIEGIRAFREVFIRRLERGQRADGRYYLADLAGRPGVCASCRHWLQEGEGNLEGRCPLLTGPGFIHAAHRCPIGRWAVGEVAAMKDNRETNPPRRRLPAGSIGTAGAYAWGPAGMPAFMSALVEAGVRELWDVRDSDRFGHPGMLKSWGEQGLAEAAAAVGLRYTPRRQLGVPASARAQLLAPGVTHAEQLAGYRALIGARGLTPASLQAELPEPERVALLCACKSAPCHRFLLAEMLNLEAADFTPAGQARRKAEVAA